MTQRWPGLIVGRGKSGNSGILGIAPKSSIVSAATLFGDTGNPQTLGRGIAWLVQPGGKVICIAAGTGMDETVRSAIEAAFKADVVVVAGVGNKPDQTT